MSKKTIIKAVCLSAVTFLIACLVFFGLTYALCPSTMASVAFRVNNKPLCLAYSERQYEKSGSTSDLILLVERSEWAEANGLTIKYGDALLLKENFKKVADKRGGDCYYRILGIICKAYYNAGKTEKSAQVALSRTGEYNAFAPTRTVAYLAAENKDKATLGILYDGLSSRSDAETNEILKSDVKAIKDKIEELIKE